MKILTLVHSIFPNSIKEEQTNEPLSLEECKALNKEPREMLTPFRNSKPFATEEFDKDSDDNGHVGFMTTAANLRVAVYSIRPASELEVKRIAGKIIPAIATTTAAICGFIALEMYKVHSSDKKTINEYRSGFINLPISMFSTQEPLPAPKGLWETTANEYSADLTMKELIDKLEEAYECNIFSI